MNGTRTRCLALFSSDEKVPGTAPIASLEARDPALHATRQAAGVPSARSQPPPVTLARPRRWGGAGPTAAPAASVQQAGAPGRHGHEQAPTTRCIPPTLNAQSCRQGIHALRPARSRQGQLPGEPSYSGFGGSPRRYGRQQQLHQDQRQPSATANRFSNLQSTTHLPGGATFRCRLVARCSWSPPSGSRKRVVETGSDFKGMTNRRGGDP